MLYFNKSLFISDIHFFHKNINVFEYEKRKCFTDKPKEFFEQQKNDEVTNEMKEIDKRMMDFILESILSEEREVEKVYFVGDFFFNFNTHKYETYDYDFKLIEEFMNKIPYKKILIVGNHDDLNFYKPTKEDHFYKKIFDEINYLESYENDNEIVLITHYPIWFTETDVNQDYKREQSNPAFEKIDMIIRRRLKGIDKNKKIINIHWHIHSSPLEKKLEWVEYVNVSIENFL